MAGPTVPIEKLAAVPGNYGSTYYVKLIWILPEEAGLTGEGYTYDTIQYRIDRKLPSDVSYVTIGTMVGRSTVFYDSNAPSASYKEGRIKPNTRYQYRVDVTDLNGDSAPPGGYPISVVTTSPNFSLYSTEYITGSEGWTLKCWLSIYDDDSGRPKIVGYTNDRFSSDTVTAQFAEINGNWFDLTVADGNVAYQALGGIGWPLGLASGNGWVTDISPGNSTIDFGTTYKVRMVVKDSSNNIIKYTNTVLISTYEPGPESFPNMFPNAGLQYGYYDPAQTYISPSTLPAPKNGAYGTFQRWAESYPSDYMSICASPVTVRTGTDVTKFYSGKAFHFTAPFVWDNQKGIINLAAFNFPKNPVQNYNWPTDSVQYKRRFALFCRVTEEPMPSFLLYAPLVTSRVEISRTDGLEFMTATVIYGTEADWENPVNRETDEIDTTAKSDYAVLLSGVFDAPSGYFLVTEATIPCSEATYVDSTLNTDNFGSSTVMYADYVHSTGRKRRMYVKFDLSSIPEGSIILSSKIWMFCITGDPNSEYFFRPNFDWDEGTLTWDLQGTYPGDFTVDDNFPIGYSLWRCNLTDVNDTVQGIVAGTIENRGWMFRSDEGDDVTWNVGGRYASNEDAIGRYPYMKITYLRPAKEGELQQTRFVIKALPDCETWRSAPEAPIAETYVGDFMLFDLTRVFGGNGDDIIDSSSIIEKEHIKAVVEASTDKWWDFDYADNIVDIPFDFTAVVNGTLISAEVWSPYDDMGGMDTTGCLPLASYAFQYKKMGTSYFREKGISIDHEHMLTDPPVTIGNEDSSSVDALSPNSTYQLRYLYGNASGQTGFSTSTYAITEPLPSKARIISLTRWFETGFSDTLMHVAWDEVLDPSPLHPVLGYGIEVSDDNTTWSSAKLVSDSTYETDIDNVFLYPNTVYYCRVYAYNDLGNGPYSDVVSEVSVSLPTAPISPSYYFTNITGTSTAVIYSWEPPEDDGCTISGTEGIIGYSVIHGQAISGLTEDVLSPYELMFQPTYRLDKGSSSYFKVAAITDYTDSISSDLGGIYTDLKKVTFMTYTETVKVRGIASSEGYIDFYFTARTGDGSYVQLTGSEGEAAFWRLTDHTSAISANSNIYSIKALILEESSIPGTNVFKNGITNPALDGYSPGWPLSTDGSGPVYSVTAIDAYDLFGESVKIVFTLQPYDEYNWDVNTSMVATEDSETSVGLDGMGTFLVVTDYTTDVSFYSTNTTLVRPYYDFMTGTTGSLIWTVNAAIVYNPYLNKNENTPLTSKEFFVPVYGNESLDDIAIRIGAPDSVYNLQNRLNEYFLGDTGEIDDAISQLYEDADPITPFIVSTEVVYESDKKYHMKINIQTTVEGVQNQITCRTSNLKAFYLATKANTYYVNDMTYELRSFEDMYGRQKPGSTPVLSGYVKRSYGFKFDLDYIREYSEEENSSIDLTPIPGTSSSNAIGLDVIGTTRTISVSGVRVDNSNYWMFHAPYEYVDDVSTSQTYGQVVQSGIIYMGTSNWGWCKFMKAVMGTFQFIDGPYRLVLMTIPSSLMQQYVPDRHCKYQYPDGTYIVQAGIEDMCYVMIERFSTRKNDEMFNAIEYDLILRRVIPLGSSI